MENNRQLGAESLLEISTNMIKGCFNACYHQTFERATRTSSEQGLEYDIANVSAVRNEPSRTKGSIP